MYRLSVIVSLFLLALSQSSVLASPCVTFAINFNLLGFGFNGKDRNAGTQDVWVFGRSFFDSPIHTTFKSPPHAASCD
jgi:hypothetical protein